ncbi:translesion DNA synthesis-associated protein ImuA [Hydrogenophaga sp.]|uniref:translesion DNA synthesis-associated protein ImuA n=1 Tax=Hydrogenophaga sp. TaxID=1904254 RepID=UPI0025C3AD3F|nr:translesion DNA synthesis-associated protein ImuA [Hydrogenophaga sp.]
MPPSTALLADTPSAGPSVPCASRPVFAAGALPAAVSAALWRGDQLGAPVTTVHPSGFHALDAELPGGGWPGHSLTEILSPQSATLEWRLLGPALQRLCATGHSVVVVGPPRSPHLPGLRLAGLNERLLIWVQAETPAERLWSAEQLVKANAGGALLVWLPQVRPEQVRRLQVLAAGHEGPVFLCRPSTAAQESSAAPLRVLARVGPDWALQLDVLKRKGPPLAATLHLPSVPAGLLAILTPRLQQPSAWLPRQPEQVTAPAAAQAAVPRSSADTRHALVRAAAAPPRRRVPLH